MLEHISIIPWFVATTSQRQTVITQLNELQVTLKLPATNRVLGLTLRVCSEGILESCTSREKPLQASTGPGKSAASILETTPWRWEASYMSRPTPSIICYTWCTWTNRLKCWMSLMLTSTQKNYACTLWSSKCMIFSWRDIISLHSFQMHFTLKDRSKHSRLVICSISFREVI